MDFDGVMVNTPESQSSSPPGGGDMISCSILI